MIHVLDFPSPDVKLNLMSQAKHMNPVVHMYVCIFTVMQKLREVLS